MSALILDALLSFIVNGSEDWELSKYFTVFFYVYWRALITHGCSTRDNGAQMKLSALFRFSFGFISPHGPIGLKLVCRNSFNYEKIPRYTRWWTPEHRETWDVGRNKALEQGARKNYPQHNIVDKYPRTCECEWGSASEYYVGQVTRHTSTRSTGKYYNSSTTSKLRGEVNQVAIPPFIWSQYTAVRSKISLKLRSVPFQWNKYVSLL